jgi:phosphoglycerate dehydrogenase-like enzyme
MKIAILDDYQNVALSIADWSAVAKKADITVFNDHIDQTDALIERLLPFDVICVMRERTPLHRDIIERLPRLRFIASTGPRNISIDMAAVNERGILDDRFHKTSIDEANRRGTGSMLVDSSFEKS